jgi:hypothetical protein
MGVRCAGEGKICMNGNGHELLEKCKIVDNAQNMNKKR